MDDAIERMDADCARDACASSALRQQLADFDRKLADHDRERDLLVAERKRIKDRLRRAEARD